MQKAPSRGLFCWRCATGRRHAPGGHGAAAPYPAPWPTARRYSRLRGPRLFFRKEHQASRAAEVIRASFSLPRSRTDTG